MFELVLSLRDDEHQKAPETEFYIFLQKLEFSCLANGNRP